MRKSLAKTIMVAVGVSVLASMTAFAGEWKQDNVGWWYQNDDGGNTKSGWQNIDGKDYYFNEVGYMLKDTTTPDGYKVGSDGAWIPDGTQATEEVLTIQIPEAKGYGSVKGNITWQYNRYVGTKADVGAEIYLIPLDFNIKGGGNEKLSRFMDTKGHNGVYYGKVDGFGQYNIDNVPTGKYMILIKSDNTNDAMRFENETGWNRTVNELMGQFLTDKELDKFKTFLGFDSYITEIIEIQNGESKIISYDFGYTYI